MKRFQSILSATLLTLAMSSATFAGNIYGRSGNIYGIANTGNIYGSANTGNIYGSANTGNIYGIVDLADDLIGMGAFLVP
jgi:hypothetical protein